MLSRTLGLAVFVVFAGAAPRAAELSVDGKAVQEYIVSAKKAGRSKTMLPDTSGKPYTVSVDSLTPDGLMIRKDGGKIEFTWKQLRENELFWLGRGLLPEDDVEGHLLVGRLAVKLGLGPEFDASLERLQLLAPKDYRRIERMRSEIADQLAATTVKPPPVSFKPKEPSVAANPGTTDSVAIPVAKPGVNHEGRPLPPLPKFDKPITYNTPEADAIMSAMQIFPVDNPWNRDISKLPVHAKSDEYVKTIGGEKRVHINHDMGFVIVPPNFPRVDLTHLDYNDEADKGPYPIPDNTPIEGWPFDGGKLEDVQRNGDGDRHAVVVDPFALKCHEFYVMRKNDKGWEAAGEASFDLTSNKLRPMYWTSSDAAGLPLLPSIVRYDECERGMVEHALRFTVRRSRRAFILPATHYASRSDDESLPPMGLRFRLKADVKIDDLPKHAKAIALALKKYGMFVADNGSDWFISTSGDSRLQGLEALHRLKGSDFEVVETGEKLVLARGR